jgi:ABC-type amino acid transport substrate-binding protein
MHFSFDTEHALRLVLDGEMPAVIDDELAVRYLQPDAKSAEKRPFELERRRLVSIYGPQLPRGQRAHLALSGIGRRLGLYRVLSGSGG